MALPRIAGFGLIIIATVLFFVFDLFRDESEKEITTKWNSDAHAWQTTVRVVSDDGKAPLRYVIPSIGFVGAILIFLPWNRWSSVVIGDSCSNIRVLRRGLKSKSEYQRWRAIERLGQLGADAQQALPDLLPFIDGPVASHRIAAIDAIARIGATSDATNQALSRAQCCGNVEVQRAANNALRVVSERQSSKGSTNVPTS